MSYLICFARAAGMRRIWQNLWTSAGWRLGHEPIITKSWCKQCWCCKLPQWQLLMLRHAERWDVNHYSDNSVVPLPQIRNKIMFLLVGGDGLMRWWAFGRWEGGREGVFLASQYANWTIKMTVVCDRKINVLVPTPYSQYASMTWNFCRISGNEPIDKTKIHMEYAKALPVSMAI